MGLDLLCHATGLCALALNVAALMHTCERSLRVQSGLAGMIWAVNNLLLGAYTAAALSLVSAGRTATSVATMQSGARLRCALFSGFVGLTLVVGGATWNGWGSAALMLASLLSTYAMFYMKGRELRWSMLLISGLWMYHAWCYESWEQMAANAATAVAAVLGSWRLGDSADDAIRPADEFSRQEKSPKALIL